MWNQTSMTEHSTGKPQEWLQKGVPGSKAAFDEKLSGSSKPAMADEARPGVQDHTLERNQTLIVGKSIA